MSSAVGVRSLVLFQAASRILTFAMNTAILRWSSPTVLGIASAKLDLLLTTILSLSRDGVRMALIRYPTCNKKDTRVLMNMAWMSMGLGLLISGILGVVFWSWAPSEINASTYHHALISYIVSALLELSTEPIVAVLTQQRRTNKKLSIEMAGLVIRMVTILLYVRADPSNDAGIWAFSIGQLMKSITIVMGCLHTFTVDESFTSFRWDDLMPNLKLYESTVCKHASEMSKQLVLKYALAQGDMWIVSWACASADQGIYAVALNYGSLVCRILLQPLEESGLQFFARATSSGTEKEKKASLGHLSIVLRLDCILSLLFGLIAPFYTGLLVKLLLGRKWHDSNMSWILAWYCLQIPAMALCGILEAFQNGTMAADWYSTTRNTSIALSITYTVLSVILTRSLGTVGLIIAGIVNFTLRALLGLAYLRSYLGPSAFKKFIKNSIPSKKLWLSVLTVSIWSYNSKNELSSAITSATLLVTSLFVFEGEFLTKLRRVF